MAEASEAVSADPIPDTLMALPSLETSLSCPELVVLAVTP